MGNAEYMGEPVPVYQPDGENNFPGGREERDLGFGHAPIHHARPVHHPVHHAPVHHAPVHHAPVHHAVHHAPLVHKKPVHHAPVKAHHAPAYDGPDRPYTYE